MVGTITFDAVNNVVTGVGGTSGSPIGFVDLYNADVSGSRILKAAAASPFTASLTTPVKPCESLALKLSLVVTLFSVAGTVALSGKDAWGNSQTETLNITANGSVVSTKYYASIDANGVVAVGTFTVAVTQPRWGVVWKQATLQYTFDAKIMIGDGVNQSYFGDTGKQIIFNAGVVIAGGQFWFNTTAKVTVNFGELIDATLKVTRRGIDFTSNEATYYGRIGTSSISAEAIVNFYSCKIKAINNTAALNYYGWTRLWNCTADGYTNSEITSQVADVYNLMSTRAQSGIRPTPTCTFNRITAMEPYFGFQRYGTGNVSISNFYVRGAALAGNVLGYLNGLNAAPSNVYLKNVDSDAWTFTWVNSASAVVYEQYGIDLVTDPSAVVTFKNADGSTAFSVTTDAVTGAIASQTVNRGYYTQATANVRQDYGPFTLTITKAGKMPYTQTGIILSVATSWLIQLRDQLSGTAAVGDVAVTKTFYKDDADSKLNGTLALTGDANAGDVKVGKKFYKDSLTNQLTGTLDQSDSTAAEEDIIVGKTAYVNFIKKTGTFNPVAGGGPSIVTVVKADPEEVVFVDGKPALLIDEKDPEIYTFINKKKPSSGS